MRSALAAKRVFGVGVPLDEVQTTSKRKSTADSLPTCEEVSVVVDSLSSRKAR